MNMLIDDLPSGVTIDGEYYDLNTDYRYSVIFEMLMFDDSVSDQDKLQKALHLLFKDGIPTNVTEAVKQIMWFYRGGKDEQPGGGKGRHKRNDRLYDYDFDDVYIYAAFLQQYGVDLQDEYIHWWKFKAMFQSLGENTEFVKIMGYRGIKITSSMSKSQKEFYQEMKRIHALPIPKSEAEKIKAIEEALLNGGDVSALLAGR